ncbi:MAG: retropepsin-like domain-containing protein [Pyrinomonadaceae bacterium]|nr:retropepsin-like domain-containing protein [Pyrinomonadaceae bacterium]
MPTYDADLFNPPAPVARVTLRDPGNGNTTTNVLMLIDSGADITLVPQASIDELKCGIDPQQSYELRGFDGQRSVAQSVQLDLVFVRRTFRGRFLIVNSDAGILGRDVLNHVAVLLDGPQLSWREQSTTPPQ